MDLLEVAHSLKGSHAHLNLVTCEPHLVMLHC